MLFLSVQSTPMTDFHYVLVNSVEGRVLFAALDTESRRC